MNKKIFLLSIFVISIFVSFILYTKFISEPTKQNDSLPSKYIIKPVDDQCPEGKKMTYYHDDVPPPIKKDGCKQIAKDAGEICIQNSDCINNCIFSTNDLDKLQCESSSCLHTGANCPVTVNCKGIQGRCEATENELNLTIIKPGQVQCSCAGV